MNVPEKYHRVKGYFYPCLSNESMNLERNASKIIIM